MTLKRGNMFKLDPAKEISDNDLDALCMSDTMMIGGTDNVTEDNVIHLMSRVRRYPLPLVLEISNIESIILVSIFILYQQF